MPWAIFTIYINITSFVLIGQFEKDHSMTETHRFKNVVIFFQTTLIFVMSRTILRNCCCQFQYLPGDLQKQTIGNCNSKEDLCLLN